MTSPEPSEPHLPQFGTSHPGLPGRSRGRAWLVMLACYAVPIAVFAVAVQLASRVNASGQCSGIGFGCTLTPHDGCSPPGPRCRASFSSCSSPPGRGDRQGTAKPGSGP
jgi:hypothetical protein